MGSGPFLLKTLNLEAFPFLLFSFQGNPLQSNQLEEGHPPFVYFFFFLLRYNFVGTERSGGDSLQPS